MTTYIVFRRVGADGAAPTFQRIGQAEAHDAKTAIAKAAEGLPEDLLKDASETTFAATTARSWVEATADVQLELKVRVR